MAGNFGLRFGLFLVFVLVLRPSNSAPRAERDVSCQVMNIEDNTARDQQPLCPAVYNVTKGIFKSGVCLNSVECMEKTFPVNGHNILAYCVPYDTGNISTAENANG
ncbi:uncharacterized protein LOC122258647 [Penaeus japonicus]|uniref:uncharacterized protein LOC122258647 n=1 Tax=Penaeus japonicus TaxID=27405 RepID=UPI001C70BCF3|nr:uncharacterized protein LOC122258647 [Penaeus japonicus]